LHPDILPTVADLLIQASNRMQLVVTTQSDILVDALSDTPEAILICEKESGSTRMKRLQKEQLTEWLEKYALGELWRMGEIGGKRW
jgi:predicted ATPase